MDLTLVSPRPVANDTLDGLRVTFCSRETADTVTLVFRSFEDLVESMIIERLQDGASMMFGTGIWKRPEERNSKKQVQ